MFFFFNSTKMAATCHVPNSKSKTDESRASQKGMAILSLLMALHYGLLYWHCVQIILELTQFERYCTKGHFGWTGLLC